MTSAAERPPTEGPGAAAGPSAGPPAGAPILFIVSRGEKDLRDYLVHHFADEPEVRVILDRRAAERRHAWPPAPPRVEMSPAPGADRRQADRRRQQEIAAQFRLRGFAIVMPGPRAV